MTKSDSFPILPGKNVSDTLENKIWIMGGETNTAWEPSSLNVHLPVPQALTTVPNVLRFLHTSPQVYFIPPIHNDMKAGPFSLAWGHRKWEASGGMYWEETKTFVKDLGWMLVEEAHDWQSCFNAKNNTANSEHVSQGYLNKKKIKKHPGDTEDFNSLNILQAIWNVKKKKVR